MPNSRRRGGRNSRTPDTSSLADEQSPSPVVSPQSKSEPQPRRPQPKTSAPIIPATRREASQGAKPTDPGHPKSPDNSRQPDINNRPIQKSRGEKLSDIPIDEKKPNSPTGQLGSQKRERMEIVFNPKGKHGEPKETADKRSEIRPSRENIANSGSRKDESEKRAPEQQNARGNERTSRQRTDAQAHGRISNSPTDSSPKLSTQTISPREKTNPSQELGSTRDEDRKPNRRSHRRGRGRRGANDERSVELDSAPEKRESSQFDPIVRESRPTQVENAPPPEIVRQEEPTKEKKTARKNKLIEIAQALLGFKPSVKSADLVVSKIPTEVPSTVKREEIPPQGSQRSAANQPKERELRRGDMRGDRALPNENPREKNSDRPISPQRQKQSDKNEKAGLSNIIVVKREDKDRSRVQRVSRSSDADDDNSTTHSDSPRSRSSVPEKKVLRDPKSVSDRENLNQEKEKDSRRSVGRNDRSKLSRTSPTVDETEDGQSNKKVVGKSPSGRGERPSNDRFQEKDARSERNQTGSRDDRGKRDDRGRGRNRREDDQVYMEPAISDEEVQRLIRELAPLPKPAIPMKSVVVKTEIQLHQFISNESFLHFLKEVQHFIEHELFVERGSSIVVAVSGGVDSVSMLYILDLLSKEFGYVLNVAHINHLLRGEASNSDEQRVRNLCLELDIPFHHTKVHVEKLARQYKQSIELTAREARYRFLERVAKTVKAGFVATAHTADDVAETLLLNLIRGSGLTGLAGLPPRRNLAKRIDVVRPLIRYRKSILKEMAVKYKWEWCEDDSNSLTKFTRNRVRHDLLPILEREFNPSIVDVLNRTSRLLHGADALIQADVRNLHISQYQQATDRLYINLSGLSAMGNFLFGEYVQHEIKAHFSVRAIPMTTVDALRKLLQSEVGSMFEIKGRLVAVREREHLTIAYRAVAEVDSLEIEKPGEYYLAGKHIIIREVKKSSVNYALSPGVEFIDKSCLPFRVTLRVWRAGDKIQPLGMSGKMLVADFLTNEKIESFDRLDQLVLAGQTEVYWVCGKRVNDTVKIGDSTQTVWSLESKDAPKDR